MLKECANFQKFTIRPETIIDNLLFTKSTHFVDKIFNIFARRGRCQRGRKASSTFRNKWHYII